MEDPAHGETVTVLRPGEVTGTDAYGNDVTAPPTETSVDGCSLAPQAASSSSGNAGGSEDTSARDMITRGLILYAPPDADVRPTDQVRVPARWGGGVWDVVGQPGAYRSPFTGSIGPVVVTLQQISG